MRTVLLFLLALGLVFGMMIGLAHVDTPAVITPPLTPVYPVQYGERE